MILSVYGEDTYRAREYVRTLVLAFREKHDSSGMNVTDMTFSGNDGEIASAVRAMPFLALRRMTIVRTLAEAVTTKKEAKAWAERLTGLGEASVIVLVDALPSQNMEKNKLLVALKEVETIHTYPFDQLSGAKLKAWVRQQVTGCGVPWDATALDALIERSTADTWQMAHALHKVSHACRKMGVVTAADVCVHVDAATEDALFAFLDAVRLGNRARAIQLLRQEQARGTASEQLLRLLFREMRLLTLLRAYGAEHGKLSSQAAARELGIHPFVAKKMMPRAVSMSASELRGMMDAVLRADFAQKRTSASADALLEQLVLDLISS